MITPISPVPPEVLRVKEAAAFLRVSTDTLNDWRVVGGGPPYMKFGRQLVMYRLTDLREWINSHPTLTSTSQESA